ncbi:MAG: Gfo/Idh/MocA family oxidoreductase [Sediminibacterium sp.]|nr:Gfo/Idh/MocA family oxidoreductase [Sediminibacterium sp.]
MTEIKVVVWGLGPHAIKNILPAVKACSGMELYGVCSRNNDMVSKVTKEYGCSGWNTSFEMLKDDNVDVVYLATPTGLHFNHGREILLASKHFWCEKPLAQSLNQVEGLLDVSQKQNVTVAEGFMYLYHPQFLHLQQILKSGKLGKINNINCRFGIPPLDRPGFRNNPDLGGGAFLDVGSYLISAISSLLIDSDIDVLFSEIKFSSSLPVDTFGCAVLSIANETYITLEWSTNNSYRNEIDIWGSRGSVSTTRIFSKPYDYVPYFKFSDLHGNENSEMGKSANHFLEMFSSFRDILFDSKKAEKERFMILRRARLMNKIQSSNSEA